MRTTFGTPLSRFFRGGVLLSELESEITKRLVSELPPELRQIVEAQFSAYVLVQREVDGRALNFYPRRKDLPNRLSAPLLQMDVSEAPLVRMQFSLGNPSVVLHAVLTAVQGRVFCVSFSQDVRPLKNPATLEVLKVVHAWRSNFRTISG
jgi:hypothetical protein